MNRSQSELSAIDKEYHEIILNYCKGHKNISHRLRTVLNSLSVQLSSGYVKNLPKKDKKRLRNLGELLIKLYQELKTDDTKEHTLTIKEKTLWLSSKVYGRYYFPYYDQVGSFRHIENQDGQSVVDIKDIEGALELCQGTFPTCSFVCALQSLIYYIQPDQFVNKLIQSCSTGTFLIPFHFNGTRRICIVDSYISAGHVRSVTNSNLRWPALIEKAFLQIYNCQSAEAFNGSNFSNDCFLLSGFAPEYISVGKLTEGRMDQIFNACINKHTALMALGTDRLTSDTINRTKLLPLHDYIVDNVEKQDQKYTFTLRDPSRPKKYAFTYTFSQVCRLFQTLYVNWNTQEMFKVETNAVFVGSCFHKFDNGSYIDYPQFAIRASSVLINGPIWVLIEEHLDKDAGKKAMEGKLLSIKWFEGEKQVWSPDSGLIIDTFNSNGTRFILSKVQLPQVGRLTGVIQLKKNATGSFVYSVNCFSDFPVLISIPTRDKFSVQFDGLWTMTESGGNWSKQTYCNNPQFELVCNEGGTAVNCTIGIFTQKDVHVSAAIFDNEFSEFRHLNLFDKRTLVAGQPTEYRPGYQCFSVSLQPKKTYVIVCSTYNTHILEEFKLRVKADLPLSLKKLSTSLGIFEEVKKRAVPELPNKSWIDTYRFVLRRGSKVALKVHFSAFIDGIQLVEESSRNIVFEGANLSHKTAFLGSQKHSIPLGTYILQVKASNNFGSTDMDVILGTDYRVELTPL